jgi:23S rRNA (cytosine1962-C5)-methyltransferase
MECATLRLKRHEERRLRGGHLWIYSNEVDSSQTPLRQFRPGEQAAVEDHSGKRLGTAYVNPASLICARLISRDSRCLDQDLLVQRLERALALRQRLFSAPCYRLVYGESDLLPGLVVDRYGPHLSVQLNTAGMAAVQSAVIDALRRVVGPESILLRNDSSTRVLEGLPQEVVIGYGRPPEEVELEENGVRFIAPLHSGQKTGWFYDQRLNRAWLKDWVAGKRLLDVFSYTGGFAVQGAVFGARRVQAVDSSRAALTMAEKNARLNGVADRFSGLQGDAFAVLRGLKEAGESYDLIVVDPPAFIKRRKDHREGLRAYRRITEAAMQLLAPEGYLLAASCSMHLQRAELLDVLRGAGQSLGRQVQVLAQGGQGPDHPIHPAIAETDYLKAFFSRVWHDEAEQRLAPA